MPGKTKRRNRQSENERCLDSAFAVFIGLSGLSHDISVVHTYTCTHLLPFLVIFEPYLSWLVLTAEPLR